MRTDLTFDLSVRSHGDKLLHPSCVRLKAAWAGHPARRWRRQRGVSLFVVMVILLLALIVVLGGLAVTNVNESLVGNQSDAQRAYGAAEALLNAAQRDIRLNGRYCSGPALGSAGLNGGTPCTLRFPPDGDTRFDAYTRMFTDSTIVGALDQCANTATFLGLCLSSGPTSPAFYPSNFSTNSTAVANPPATPAVWSNGASYAAYGGNASVGGGTVSLALGSRGRYWIEVFPYYVISSGLTPRGNIPVPDGTYPYVFRITAIAQGLKNGTVSVLRTYYVPYPLN